MVRSVFGFALAFAFTMHTSAVDAQAPYGGGVPHTPSQTGVPYPGPIYAQPPASGPMTGYAPAPTNAYGSPYAGYAPMPPAPPAPDTAEDGTGTGLIIGGVITLSSFYLASVLTGAALAEACDVGTPKELEGTDIDISICSDANTDVAFIPVVGPFVAAAELEGSDLSVWPLNVALIGVGVGQVAGLGLLVASAFVGDDEPASPVQIRPIVGPTAAAMTISAAF